MPFTSTTVYGPIYSPGLVALKEAKIIFDLTSWDVDPEENLFVTGPYVADIDMLGNFEVTLFTNTNGVNNTVYDVYVSYIDENTQQNLYDPRIKKFIGTVSLSGTGPFCISDLSFTSEHSAGSFDLYAAMEGLVLSSQTSEENAGVYATSAATDADRAETAQTDATNAAITAGNHAISADTHRAAAEVAQAAAEAARDISVAAKDIVEAGGFLTLSEADGKYIQNEGVVSVAGHFTVDTPAGVSDAGFWVKHPDLAAKIQMEALDTKAAYIYMGTPTNSTAVQFFSKFNTGETILWSDWGDGSLLRFNPGNGKTLEMRRNDTTGNEVEFYVPVTAPAPTSNDHLATKAYVDGKVPVGGGVGEAPVDGTGYVRKSGTWVAEGAAFNGGQVTTDLSVSKASPRLGATSNTNTGRSYLDLGDTANPEAGGIQYDNATDTLDIEAAGATVISADASKIAFSKPMTYGASTPQADMDIRQAGGSGVLLGSLSDHLTGGDSIGRLDVFNPDLSAGNSGGRIGGSVELRASDDYGNADLYIGAGSTSPSVTYGGAKDYTVRPYDRIKVSGAGGTSGDVEFLNLSATAPTDKSVINRERGDARYQPIMSATRFSAYEDSEVVGGVTHYDRGINIGEGTSHWLNSTGEFAPLRVEHRLFMGDSSNFSGATGDLYTENPSAMRHSWLKDVGEAKDLGYFETNGAFVSTTTNQGISVTGAARRVNTASGGAAIGIAALGYNDQKNAIADGLYSTAWGIYTEGGRSAAGTGIAQAIESQIFNLADPTDAAEPAFVYLDPYQLPPANATINIQAGAGADPAVHPVSYDCHAALRVADLGARFHNGLVFKYSAIRRRSDGIARAISLPQQNSIVFSTNVTGDPDVIGGGNRERFFMHSDYNNFYMKGKKLDGSDAASITLSMGSNNVTCTNDNLNFNSSVVTKSLLVGRFDAMLQSLVQDGVISAAQKTRAMTAIG